jgi:hypothetical protein
MSETFWQSRNALPPSHRRLLPSVKRHVAHSIAVDYPKKKDERICYLYAAYNDRLAGGLNNPLKLMEKKVAMRNPLSPCGERVGVRGYGLSKEHNPSPGSHLRCDPTSPTRGEVHQACGPAIPNSIYPGRNIANGSSMVRRRCSR